jgi:uncharacterized membrane protein
VPGAPVDRWDVTVSNVGRIAVFGTNRPASLRLIPGLMIAASGALAIALIELDTRHDAERLLEYPRLSGLGADGSRGMLTAIASSMLTVAPLAFTLTLNSNPSFRPVFAGHFRNFLRDRGNRVVLGYSVVARCASCNIREKPNEP